MADPRFRKVQVVGRDGVVRSTRIRRDNLDRYAEVVVNNRGKKALIKLDSAQRAARIVRGSGRRLVRLTISAKIETGGKSSRMNKDGRITRKSSSDLRAEITARVVVPEDEAEEHIEAFREWAQEQANAVASGTPVVVGIERSQPAPGGMVGVEQAVARIRGKEQDQVSEIVRAFWEQQTLEDFGVEADEDFGVEDDFDPADAILRARAEQQRTKTGRTVTRWRDPVTGRWTLDPSAVRL